jgi:SAM-dependent methyltransferase
VRLDNREPDQQIGALMQGFQGLSSKEYLRERIAPSPGQPDYLHLSDLLLGLKTLIPKNLNLVLDYGCGGSPYRPLFGSCIYHRADLAGAEDIDFRYGADSRLPSELADYDCVLSSQVLEHVASPLSYLAECYRVLKPGGSLVVSTHGLFPDHAYPHDYWRWTVYGLQKLVEQIGFKIDRLVKLTTGPRAAVCLAERELYRLWFNKHGGLYSRMLHYGGGVVRRAGARRRHEACDASFAQYRMVDANQRGHSMYIAIALLAHR